LSDAFDYLLCFKLYYHNWPGPNLHIIKVCLFKWLTLILYVWFAGRYTAPGGETASSSVYAILLEWPSNNIVHLGALASYHISSIEMLGLAGTVSCIEQIISEYMCTLALCVLSFGYWFFDVIYEWSFVTFVMTMVMCLYFAYSQVCQ